MKRNLKKIVSKLKIDILKMFYISQTGHLASALSCIEILSVVFFHKRKDDKVILSKGHGAAALYAVLAQTGAIPHADLRSFYGYNSKLLALASYGINGIDVSTGSLGQGICFATGIAKAYKADNKENYVFCILGDGEMQEGSVWEAAMFAAKQHLDNMIVILDYNHIQASGLIEDIAEGSNIKNKWNAFGWNVEEIDGHNLCEIENVLEKINIKKSNKPNFIIANTIKGNGISFIQNRQDCHMLLPKDNEWITICKDFGITLEELKNL